MGLFPIALAKAQRAGTPAPWEDCPSRLISLWEMLNQDAAEFFFFGTEMQGAERMLWTDLKPNQATLPLDYLVAAVLSEALLKQLRARCEALHMRTTLDAIGTLEWHLKSRTRTAEAIHRQLQVVLQTARSELKTAQFLYVPDDKARIYEEPLIGWEQAISWSSAIIVDIEEAVKCFALNRFTACVFHLMRVMEIGVQTLGAKFRVTNLSHKIWADITNEVSQAVKAMSNKTGPEIEAKALLSEVCIHLDHVRLAWRNPTMHPKQTYTEEEARDIFQKVQTFMNRLATVV